MILDRLREWAARFHFFFRRRELIKVDDEFQFHIERQIEANRATGMDEAESRRQAFIAFGGIEHSREACYEQRPGWWLETLLQDLRYAFRGLRRNPSYATTAILTLALAIGATTAVFTTVDKILFRNLPYTGAERLVSVGLTAPISPNEFLLTDSYYEWREHQVPFTAITSEMGAEPCDLTQEKPARLSCSRVEASFLPTLGVTPVLGRGFTPEEDRPDAPRVALISYQLWKTTFALDPAILQKTINIDGHATRIIGVLPKTFEMPTLEASDILVPEALDQARVSVSGSNAVTIVYGFARLKPGISMKQAQAALKPMFDDSLRKAPPRFRNEVHLRVRSLRDQQMQDVSMTAWLLFGTVMIVLTIACTNVATLMMARGATRQHELAVRTALGASRARMVRQALTESLLLFSIAALAGCVVAETALHVFIALAPEDILFLHEARINLRVFLFTLIVSLLCALVFGLAPALQKPRSHLLGSRSVGAQSRAALRQWLVSAEIAASMVLMIGGMLLFRSFWKLQNQPLGMQTSNVVTASLSLGQQRYPTQQSQMAFFRQLETRLRRLPGVKACALSDALPPAAYEHSMLYGVIGIAGKPKPQGGTGGTVWWRWVTPDYFSALHIPFLQGEGFTEEEQNSNGHFMVLSKMLAARMFPGENPIGQHLQPGMQGPTYTVVGVADNVTNGGLSRDELPELYRLRRNRAEDWDATVSVILETGFATAAVESWIRSDITGLDSTLPVQIDTLHHAVQRIAARPRFETLLVSCFALVGLLLALVGLYGVVAFLVAQRRREIGVRIALGASRADILRLVVAKGMLLVTLGGAAGLLAAFFLSRLLTSLLFTVSPHDPLSLAAVVVLLVVVAVPAMLVPAWSAMKVDPNTALRCE